ncbi:hypothetical protein GCM10010345_26010 [Streptomyces canarius]|uniref:Uncharacterized protein n=1 Tax=Streptomyces canarius TaxID=285453 RepID=A0ABQ3CLL9_9ACTN|nr:hypothetical protein GCM10010345_26010 [Streptomyces canarius]
MDGFPPSITCHWTSGHDTEEVWFWAPPLLYAGPACSAVCSVLLLANRPAYGNTLRRNGRDA